VGWIDLVLAVLVVLAALRGLQLGAMIQVSSFVGFWIGLAGGVLLVLAVARPLSSGGVRTGLTIAIVLGAAVAAGILGRIVGGWAATTMKRLHLGAVDSGVGAALGAVSVLLSAWLVAGFLVQSPVPWLSAAVGRSAVLRSVDHVLPPVPGALSQVQGLLASSGFPSVFASLLPPSTDQAARPSAAVAGSLAAPALGSVVKVFAPACGAYEEGTAFVVADRTLVTNAHVVAGMSAPAVIIDGHSVPATPVLFDPQLDLAVLKVAVALGPALALDTGVATNGEQAAFVGFPGNGPMHVGKAAVTASFDALGRDIYNSRLTRRRVYELSAAVHPGSSGSPLMGPGGRVIGVVFSRSTVSPTVGYALTSGAVLPDVAKALPLTRRVSTAGCAAG
jgi:S1-C subfamily serine protease